MTESTIVVVEDEAIIAEDIQYSLEDAGYTVPDTFSKGENVLNWLSNNTANIVLMDVMLAGELDGIETAQKIQAQWDIPIVYLTSFTNEHILQRAKLTSPFGYIVKPFKNRELFATIEMALYKHKMEKKLEQSFQYKDQLNFIQAFTETFQTLYHDELANSDNPESIAQGVQNFTITLNALLNGETYSPTKSKLEPFHHVHEGFSLNWENLKSLT